MARSRNKPVATSRSLQQHRFLKTVVLLLVVGAIAALVYHFMEQQAGPDGAGPVPSGQTTTNAAATSAQVNPGFKKLIGRWQRPDGGYILDIKSVEPQGTMAAAYYNPQPINVARAEAKEVDGATKVFLELRGPGYPGSTYTLTYQPERDELEGVYFQAAMGAYYDVFFVRMK